MKNWVFIDEISGEQLGASVVLPDDSEPKAPHGYLAVQGQLKNSQISAGDLNALQRDKRNSLLNWCDWTQVPDSPLTDEQRAQWRTYRKALRDLTDQADFPSGTQWPEPPNTPIKKDKP
jgi:hypothetical protein